METWGWMFELSLVLKTKEQSIFSASEGGK